MLGDYALTTPQETLLQNGNQSIGNDVARLKGARFVSASEIDAGQRFSESRVKQLTGGDMVVGRFLYGEHFEFKPQAKFWIATNHKPEIRGTDNGIWDRIALIPFLVRIPEDQRDKQLPMKLRAELPGILRWVVEGCLQWQRVGLVAPSEVRDATQGYRDEMDVVKKFLDDDCRLDSTKRTSLAELYAGFSKWADVSNERTITQHEFNKRLRERGFKEHRTSTTRFWEGIELIQRVPAAFPTSQDWPWGERVAS